MARCAVVIRTAGKPRRLPRLLALMLCLSPASGQAQTAAPAPTVTRAQAAAARTGEVAADMAEETGNDRHGDVPARAAEAEASYPIRPSFNPANPCDRLGDVYGYEKTWYDDTQAYINTRFCEPALWFDNFFASDRIFDEGVAGTYVRWRNDLEYDQEDGFSFRLGLSASVELPGLERRLRLTLESEEDEDVRDVAAEGIDNNKTSLGLQGDIFRSSRARFNISATLSPRLRLRYRYTYPAQNDIILRLTQEAQWQDGVNSARSQFDVEKLFLHGFLLRSVSEGKISEAFDGIDWLQALILFQRLDKRSSLSYESSVNGISEPILKTTNYRLGIRFRKNFHRKWLFYELAPDMTWPIDLDDDRQSLLRQRRSRWRIFFRLEIHFGNARRKRYEDYY